MCTTYLTQDLHHLGIFAGVCEKINLIARLMAGSRILVAK